MERRRGDQVNPSNKRRISSGNEISPRKRANQESVNDDSPHKKGSLDGFIVTTKSPVSSTEIPDSRRTAISSNSAVKTRIEDRFCLKKCSDPPRLEDPSCSEQPKSAAFLHEDKKREEFANEFLAMCFSAISPSKEVRDLKMDEPHEDHSLNKLNGKKDMRNEDTRIQKTTSDISKNEKTDTFKRKKDIENGIQTTDVITPGKTNTEDNDKQVKFNEVIRTPEGGSSTPAHSSKKPPCTPYASGDNKRGKFTPSGWLLENKYVSPGDSFWNEAIRLLGSNKTVEGPEIKNPENNVHTSELPVRCFDFTRDGKAEENKPSTSESVNDLSDWLSAEICQAYSAKGLKKLYKWQVECLRLEGVLEGKSLVYCASTSAGKSLVAEILMLRRILATGKKAMLVLPYVALCSEKTEHLERILESSGKRVCGFYGTQGSRNLPSDTSLAVCTIEKANSLINKLIEEGRLSELCVVVIDELHMVGDRERGYLLELMLTKLRYAAGKGENTHCSPETDASSSLQIVGMSATMPNVEAVAAWLQAAYYQTDFRPVPLDQYIKVGSVIYNSNMETVRTLNVSAELGGKDPDHVVQLCHEVVSEGHSALLFCSSRNACETTARHVAKYLPKFTISYRENIQAYKDGHEAVEELRKCPAGLDPVLADTLPNGVAYHHAGLTAEEREVVETCYRQGVVRVLTATSTLAAGVNLPARRVIFRSPRIGYDFLDGTRYRQMAGRAGRAGIDTHGESILICKPDELNRMLPILKEGCQPLQSCLTEEKNGMMRALLEVVAGGIVQTAQDVNRYVRCTLLNSTQSFEDVVKSAQDSLRWLCHKRLIEWDQDMLMYKITPLGKAAFGSSLSPEESLVVFEDLAKARESFVLSSDLHLVYEVTPIHVELEPDWSIYYQRFVELSHVDQAVANRVGVTEASLMRMAHGAPVQGRKKSPKRPMRESDQTLRVYRRFYVALILSTLVQEVPLMEVCNKFKVSRGTVQGLQDSSGRFAAMITSFCERLGWHDLEGLISKFQNRVSFGVRAEIVGLTDIPFVKAARARSLYKAGLRTVEAVAEASIPELAKALSDSSSKASTDGRHTYIHVAAAKKIKMGARRIVLDKAEEARKAAFSAFQSLGVTIPQSLSQSLYTAVGKLTEEETTKVLPSEEVQNGKENISEVPEEHAKGNILHSKENIFQPHGENSSIFAGKEVANIQPVQQVLRREEVDKGPVDVEKLEGAFEAFIKAWEESTEFFFDLHYEAGTREVHGFAICWQNSPVYYIRAASCENIGQRWSKLWEVFGKKGAMKFCWDLKNQMKLLEGGVKPAVNGVIPKLDGVKVALNPMVLEQPYVDFRVVAWLLWPDEENNATSSLEQLVKKRLPGEIAAAASRAGRWANQMVKASHNGCCRRVAQLRGLHAVLWKLMLSEGLHDPLLQLEMPLVRVLSDMETWPIAVNVTSCMTAKQLLETRIKQLEANAQVLAGMNFSLSLPADVADLLYRHLNLPVPPGCAKGKHHPSTDKQALDQLRGRHPVVSLIKEHRSLSKLLHTTIVAVLSCAKKPQKNIHDVEENIRFIHGRWLHTSTGTGRLSMEDPNLQCVEHSINFLLEEALQTKEIEVNVRQFFVPTQKDWVLLSADYSQIELRLMAHFSGDNALLSLLNRPNGDVFRMITARWTNQDETHITEKQRERTKRMVYGILYGMGMNSLAEKMGCSVNEASRYHEQFKAAFPGVSTWLHQAVDTCRRNGYIRTLGGRKRYLEKINDSKRGEQAKAERQAVNSICQGSAADLIKMAMIDLHSGLVGTSNKTLLYKNSQTIQFSMLHQRCRLLLQIHDELVLEVDKSIVHQAAAIIKACMEGAADLKVPLNVKLRTGPSWGQLKPLES